MSKTIFLLGATGSTGYEVLKRLIKDGFRVNGLVRNLERLSLEEFTDSERQLIHITEGNSLDPKVLNQAMADCDAVISALGTGTKNHYTEIYSQGGRYILAAMRHHQVKKLVTITAGLIDLSDPATDNFFLNRIIRPNYNKVYYDQTRWETILDETADIDWVCVRPTLLTNKPFTGHYRVKLKHCPEGGRKISRADLADFIVKQLSSDEMVHQKPVIAY
ncbi:NAD(P)-dependent oxidoreductase [Marinoscillum sp.]|uniref:NAD(P)-dependent oxidoreductase n=1 Tax=Marinoscillum sp. TaxID=2024838 RepID=UPI003BAB9F1D